MKLVPAAILSLGIVAPVAAQPVSGPLPAAVAQRLARERLAGTVLVPDDAVLAPSAAAVRTAPARAVSSGEPRAMRVVRDLGDVVAVDTGLVGDCVGGFAEPYALTVFVRRADLVPRAGAPIVKTYADGTAVGIDRGAPVELGPAGPIWRDPTLAATTVRPEVARLTYAVPGPAAATLPVIAGERLVCDGAPTTLAAWRQAQEARRAATARNELVDHDARAAAARAADEAKLAACRARTAKPPRREKGRAHDLQLDECKAAEFAALLSGDGGGATRAGAALDLVDDRLAPWCGVEIYAAGAPAPRVDGKPMGWPARTTANAHVVRAGARYLADVGVPCGRIRYAVTADAVGSSRAGLAGLGRGGDPVKLWIPKPGPVTWPDGAPAGTYRGDKRYHDVVERGDRICVAVTGIAERVCHPKRTTRTATGYAWDE